MKIYFEDGTLKCHSELNFQYSALVNADDGVSSNLERLDKMLQDRQNSVIYTNSILAFSNKYAWNDELKVPEIYIRTGRSFTRIDKLTDREIRESHNLMKMYLAGVFSNDQRGFTNGN